MTNTCWTPLSSQAVNKSPTHYPCDFARTFRVILFSIHSDKWNSFHSQPQTALRVNQLPITKISYRVNSSKEASMRITRGNDPLNLTVYEKFRLKTLGFSEWLEVHALASKSKGKSNDLLLQSLRAKFEWVLTQAKKLGVPPLPELSTFGISVDDRKRKRSSEILQEVFVKENIVVDGMHRNLIPPPGIKGSRGRVIREPKSGIFYYNGNFNLVFQREEEFHLATTTQLIRLHDAIQR
ncbi:hypothetical protein Tco_1257699, partial [Tanacetum coccineum]